MEYQVEDISPVKRAIHVEVPEEEVAAALGATIALYRRSADLDGFRKGKVPSSIIEKRFRDQIYGEATTDMVNLHINQIVSETKSQPLSKIDFDGGQLERGVPFKYTLSFEVMPDFELPEYTGTEVEEEEPEVEEGAVEAVIDRIRNQMAELIETPDKRKPVDGDVVIINFAAYDDAGNALEGIHAENFQLALGEGQSLPGFEEIVKGLEPGEVGENDLEFPEDFLNEELAGKKVLMRVKLHAVKEKKLPEVDDDLAQKAGGFKDVEQMREAVRNSYLESRKQLYRSVAQKSLLDKLLSEVEYDLPESLVEANLDRLVQDQINRLEQQGKSLQSTGKTGDDLRQELQSQAEDMAKSEVFLLTVAKRENLQVTEQEIDFYFRQLASRMGQDFNQLKKYHMDNDLIIPVHNRLLADKAMELLYSKAEVKMVPAKENAGEENQEEGA